MVIVIFEITEKNIVRSVIGGYHDAGRIHGLQP